MLARREIGLPRQSLYHDCEVFLRTDVWSEFHQTEMPPLVKLHRYHVRAGKFKRWEFEIRCNRKAGEGVLKGVNAYTKKGEPGYNKILYNIKLDRFLIGGKKAFFLHGQHLIYSWLATNISSVHFQCTN